MEIILLTDVPKLGKKGDVIKASDGYARNFILPKKLGVEANKKNMAELKQQQAHEAKLAAEALAEAKALAEDIAKKTVELSLKVGEGGKTFGSISTKEIAEAAKAQHGLSLDKKKIALADPIRAIGNFEVGVKLHPQVQATLKVHVKEG